MAQKLIINFDKECDSLYVGYCECPPSYGINIQPGITKFVSILDDSLTGIEISDFKIQPLFAPSIPFASVLNSSEVHNFVENSKADTIYINA